MINTLERVIHPGWVTKNYEDELTGQWLVTHTCVMCGYLVNGADESLLTHTLAKHPAHSFSLELYNFRCSLHNLHTWYGLEIFEWPDRIDRNRP